MILFFVQSYDVMIQFFCLSFEIKTFDNFHHDDFMKNTIFFIFFAFMSMNFLNLTVSIFSDVVLLL